MKDLILLESFFHKHDAQIAIGLLREAGIEAILQADDAGGFRPDLTLGMGNNRVMVHKDDAAKAIEVIKPLRQNFSDEEIQAIEDMALETTPPPVSRKRNQKKKDHSFVIPLMIAGVFVLSYVFQETHKDQFIAGGQNSHVKCQALESDGGRLEECRAYYFNGALMGVRVYLGDQIHGPSKSYYYDGQLWWEGTYFKDELIGPAKSYYESGVLREEMFYQKGRLEGEYKEYYESGKLKRIGHFKSDQPHGPLRTYYEDGTLLEELNYQNGFRLDKNGKRFSGNDITYHQNGKIWGEYSYNDGKLSGVSKEYYDDGSLEFVGGFRHDKPHGEEIEYYQNGKMRLHQVFKNGELISEEWYDREGNIIWEGKAGR